MVIGMIHVKALPGKTDLTLKIYILAVVNELFSLLTLVKVVKVICLYFKTHT